MVLDVGGMKCGGCSAAVKNILLKQPGVQTAAVNLLTETAAVTVRCDQPAGVAAWKKTSCSFGAGDGCLRVRGICLASDLQLCHGRRAGSRRMKVVMVHMDHLLSRAVQCTSTPQQLHMSKCTINKQHG